MAIPYLACMAAVASFYHLPPRALPSIQAVEGGTVGGVSLNLDGSEDLGLMQVNTRWIGPIARLTRESEAMVLHRLLTQPCYNIAAGGVILRTYLNEARGDLMTAIGDYHSHTKPLHEAYRVRVVAAATRLFVTGGRR